MKAGYFMSTLLTIMGTVIVLGFMLVTGFFAGIEYTLDNANVIAIGETGAIVALGNDEHIIDLVRY